MSGDSPDELWANIMAIGDVHGACEAMQESFAVRFGLACYRLALEHAKTRTADLAIAERHRAGVTLFPAVKVADIEALIATAAAAEKLP